MTYTIGLIDDDEETNEVFESQKEMAKRKKARARWKNSTAHITSALEVIESMASVQQRQNSSAYQKNTKNDKNSADQVPTPSQILKTDQYCRTSFVSKNTVKTNESSKENRNSENSQNSSISSTTPENLEFKNLVKGTEFLAVISRLYIYNMIKDHRSKHNPNNPSDKESQLFDFLLNVHYPTGTDIQELNSIIASLSACCQYLINRDPRFYNAPFKINHLLSNNSLKINEGRSTNIFANLLDDNKILHSFIMAMHDINRKIRVGFLEYGGIEDGLSEKDRLKIDKSGKFGKRRASLIEFTRSLEKRKNTERFEYLLLSKLCAVLQLLASCCMEMYRSNRISLIKALVLAFNRVIIEEDQFINWFAKDGINVLKRLHNNNNGRIRTKTEKAMNMVFPESLLLKFLKYLCNEDRKPVKKECFLGIVKESSGFFDENWRALLVTVTSLFLIVVLTESLMIFI